MYHPRKCFRGRVRGVALVIAVLFLVATAWAHGGTPRLTRAAAGPYAVSVWTQPATPRVGVLDVSVAVMRPQDGTPVLDAVVHLTAEPLAHAGNPVTVVATPGTGGNRFLFYADLELSSPGAWRVTVSVSGAAGQGKAAFSVQVRSRGQRWRLLGGIMTGIVLLWLVWRYCLPRQRRAVG